MIFLVFRLLLGKRILKAKIGCSYMSFDSNNNSMWFHMVCSKVWFVLLIICFSLSIILYPTLLGIAKPLQPLGRHCVDVGPPGEEQDPNWCGCTWGAVYLDGKQLLGAEISLDFNGNLLRAITELRSGEDYPYYSLRASQIGAKYGDVVILTASFLTHTVTRSMRLIPNNEGEQMVNLAILPPLAADVAIPQITSVSVPESLKTDERLTLLVEAQSRTGNIRDRIVTYEWKSDKDGILGSEEVTVIRPAQLSIGTHYISVRAQNGYGAWSEVEQRKLDVLEAVNTGISPDLHRRVYLSMSWH